LQQCCSAFIFALMKATFLYKKTAAVFLLLMLLLTAVVQINHSHPSKQAVAIQVKKTVTIKQQVVVTGADNNCFLCDYQLVKNADFLFTCCKIIYPNKTYIYPEFFSERLITTICSAFANRGPPSFFNAA
jgi:hypothetical protein